MHKNCIYEYDLFESEEELGRSSTSWLLELPCSTDRILCINNNKLCCLNNLDENKITIIKLCFVIAFDDFNYVDQELYDYPDLFTYLDVVKLNNREFYVFYKIVEKKDIE